MSLKERSGLSVKAGFENRYRTLEGIYITIISHSLNLQRWDKGLCHLQPSKQTYFLFMRGFYAIAD